MLHMPLNPESCKNKLSNCPNCHSLQEKHPFFFVRIRIIAIFATTKLA